MSESLRVVVVDDSPFVCRVLTRYLQSTGEIEVVATVIDAGRACQRVRQLEPDVVTLDLEMPLVNGLEVLSQIMEVCPTPVVVISGVSGRSATMTMQALERGAVDFVLKYNPGEDLDVDVLRREIVLKVKQASDICVVRNLPSYGSTTAQSLPEVDPTRSVQGLDRLQSARSKRHGIVIIGASTGGPMALRELLAALPPDFPSPLIVIQHLPPSFTGVLAAQLNRQSPLIVKEAEDGELPVPGTVLVAPGDFHLLLGADTRIRLHDGPPIAGHRPSIDAAMQSASQAFGPRTVGILLTGMGSDGVMGLVTIRSNQGFTLVQDEASSVVFGMPHRAIERGVADRIAPPGRLAEILTNPADWNNKESAASPAAS